MADCGATGSALDRSAAQFISSALSIGSGGNYASSSSGGQPHASLAGKAIASFVTGVASHTRQVNTSIGPSIRHDASVPPPLLMPTSIPKTMAMSVSATAPQAVQDVQQYNKYHENVMMTARGGLGQSQTHMSGKNTAMVHGSNSIQEPISNTTNYATTNNMQNPMSAAAAATATATTVHPWQGPHNMHSNLQFQMMQQQMALMKMVQDQKTYQEYQQRQRMHIVNKQEHLTQHKEIPQQQQQQQQQQLDGPTILKDNVNESWNDWHQDIEEEFRSYLNSYKNDLAQDDARSTSHGGRYHPEEDLVAGHEGYVEGVSIERLAAAWEEAEREFSTEDYANIGSAYDDYDYNSNEVDGNLDGMDSTHMHYEFSQECERYGLLQVAPQQNQQRPQDSQQYMDLMSEGMKHFQQGNISEAVLCFESELRNVDGDNADAWLMLGKCHAENDEDRKAIVCLENAVERDPYSSEALLALGVSYVNELDHDRALKYLNHWITHNPNYAGWVRNNPTTTATATATATATGETVMDGKKEIALMKLKSLLNQAKTHDIPRHATGNLEQDSTADVLETLGVLCNVSREYDEAIECFQSALNVRPNDHQLWNKLGATLANSGRSEEAQEAYQKALSIKPRYARSWLNMAIAHSNLQNHEEASRCYLQALSLNPGAVHIWSYLRISLTCTERWDLLPLAASQDLDAFREFFDFVK